jgi:hypothetical protein
MPIGGAASQALWQRKVPPRIQGSVFALRTAVGYAALPLALLAAGPLADGVFEPLMRADGALAPNVGLVLGVGPGRGAALLLALVGLGAVVSASFLWISPRLRRVEREVPDHWHFPPVPVVGPASSFGPLSPFANRGQLP